MNRILASLLHASIGSAVLSTIATGQTETLRVSVDSAGVEGNDLSLFASISDDGRVVAFSSRASNLVSSDTNAAWDAFVKDRSTGITERVSVDSLGAQGDGDSYAADISADGRFVYITSYSTNLVAGDTNGRGDAFVHDRWTGTTERVSVDSTGAEGDDDSGGGMISADGQVVVFDSSASNLVAGDTNGSWDVFIHDRSSGVTERVSVDSSGVEGNGESDFSKLSADGQIVAFRSLASNLVPADGNGSFDIFVRDRMAGTTERVSVDSAGVESNGISYIPSISADGQSVAFYSGATNLVAGDRNGFDDVFVHDRLTGVTELVSVDSSGGPSNGDSYDASISGDGFRIAFGSDATNLVPGDTNGFSDAFLHDRSSGDTERVSVDSSGAQGDDWSSTEAISSNGEAVVFWSQSDNLVPSDNNSKIDVFVRDFCSTSASWSNYGSGFPGTNGIPSLTSRSNPTIGSTVTIDLSNSSGQPTVGLLFIGFQKATIPTNLGGDLLVVPALTILVTFSYGGDWFTGSIPKDEALCGTTIDLQSIEADPGAAKGVSFTPGLDMTIGD
jgi:WD40 repeat protein